MSLPVLNYSFRIGLKIEFFLQVFGEKAPCVFGLDGLDRSINAIFGINHKWPVSWLVSSKREMVWRYLKLNLTDLHGTGADCT